MDKPRKTVAFKLKSLENTPKTDLFLAKKIFNSHFFAWFASQFFSMNETLSSFSRIQFINDRENSWKRIEKQTMQKNEN